VSKTAESGKKTKGILEVKVRAPIPLVMLAFI
jgi:hypothetical protein